MRPGAPEGGGSVGDAAGGSGKDATGSIAAGGLVPSGGPAGRSAAGAGAAPGSAGGPDPQVFRLVALASGSGSNLQAIIDKLHGRVVEPSEEGPDAATGRRVRIEVGAVVSDVSGARALERAALAGIPAVACPRDAAATRAEHDAAVLEAVSVAQPDLVVLAGYMRVVSPEFVRAFPWRVINLHPALLPSFPGTTSISDAIHHGVKVTGVTVHFVDEGLDTGPIIAQEPVRVEEGDTADSLAARIHAVEHELLPATIRLIAAGKVRAPLPGSRVVQVDWDSEG